MVIPAIAGRRYLFGIVLCLRGVVRRCFLWRVLAGEGPCNARPSITKAMERRRGGLVFGNNP